MRGLHALGAESARLMNPLAWVWRAFGNRQTSVTNPPPIGYAYEASFRGQTSPLSVNDGSTRAAVYNTIANDVAGVQILHIEVDEDGRYNGIADSGLSKALSRVPNIDQGPRNFRLDVVLTLFEHGTAAIVPTSAQVVGAETPRVIDISELRVGRVVQYYPDQVSVEVFNDRKGRREIVTVPKSICAIVHNPFYTVMNEQSSTFRRLTQKLAMLDDIDRSTSNRRLDLLVQLPYTIKTETQKKQAAVRQKSIEEQLENSKLGIAYIDATEKVVQLNRPVESDLGKRIEELTKKFYTELGVTPEIMNGTATEGVMANYYTRTVYPVVESIVEAMRIAFIDPASKTEIYYARATMALVTMETLGKVVDALSRNEVVTPNEVRHWIGLPPSKNPKADELINSNMPQEQDNTQMNTQEDGQNGT